jgi:hypothetical protein
MYYNREAQPITREEWTGLYTDDYKTVAADEVKRPDGSVVIVSTIWLGLDHRFNGGGAPIIFESMVFPTEGDRVDFGAELDAKRYCTEAEALEGHRALVARYAVPEPAVTGREDER